MTTLRDNRRIERRSESDGRCVIGGCGRLGDTGTSRLPRTERQKLSGAERDDEGRAVGEPGRSPWADCITVVCRDGKARRVAPGVPLLAHGIPGRVAQLRGLGNAIIPQVAATFIAAYLETTTTPTAREVRDE